MFRQLKKVLNNRKLKLKQIVANTDEPTFENTILALDKSGALLDKVRGVFGPLNSANTNDKMQDIAREISPMLTTAPR